MTVLMAPVPTQSGGAGNGGDNYMTQPIRIPTGTGNDTISKNGEDKIDLSAFTEITSVDDLTITTTDDGVVIDLTEHGGGTILFATNSVYSIDDVADLDASDFVFDDGL